MNNDGYTYRDIITPEYNGIGVLQYYAMRYPHSSTAEWSERLQSGAILRNGVIAEADDIVQPGDELVYHREAWQEADVPMEFSLLFDHTTCSVFDKPAGLPVLPGGGFLENTLLYQVRARFGDKLSPVHRLGRGTSGAVLFSKSSDAAAMLAAAMRERRIRKTYLALVEGIPAEDVFSVDTPIGPVAHPLLGHVYAADEKGKPSLSHCRVLYRNIASSRSLLSVDIPTGRPHQIRIHVASVGFPLVGDPLYGEGGVPKYAGDDMQRAAVPGDCGYFLHSWRLEFRIPASSQTAVVVAPPPPELRPM